MLRFALVTDTNKEFPQYEHVRFQLKNAWNTNYRRQLADGNVQRVITPFRAVNNAGDLLARKYYSCGGPNQTPSSRPGLKGLHLGGVYSNCDGTGVPAAACNPKYVYDGSDYVTYLKQKAMLKPNN